MQSKKSSSLRAVYTYSLFFIFMCGISVLSHADTKVKQKCLINTETIKKRQNILFVDVRGKQIFSKKHILNSINVPLSLIKTQLFLKNRKIILIGNGWNEQALLDEFTSLEKSGFNSVTVLAGGIISWFKIKKSESKKDLISLTPKEFFNNKVEKKFVPFVISDNNIKLIKTTLPHAKTVSSKETKRQLLKRLKNLGKGNNPIIIFSSYNPNVDAALNNYLRKPLRKIYYFEGGFNAYYEANNLNKMTSLSNKSKRLSTKKPVSCAN